MRRVRGCEHDGTHVSARAAVSGAGRQGIAPHSLVGQTMRAHDAGRREFVAQSAHIVQGSEFQIDDRRVCPVTRNTVFQIGKIPRDVYHAEMRVQRPDQRLDALAVALKDNDTEGFHGAHAFLKVSSESVRRAKFQKPFAGPRYCRNVLQARGTSVIFAPKPFPGQTRKARAEVSRSA